MSYERDEYMRRQEAEHDMIRMREPTARPWLKPRSEDWKELAEARQRRIEAMALEMRHLVDAEQITRIIESEEIAPGIKQRLIAAITACQKAARAEGQPE